MKLDQEVIFNFMDEQAFKTIQGAKAAFISNPPNIWSGLFMLLLVTALVMYGIDRTRRK